MKVNQFETVNEVYQGHQIRKLLWNSMKEWTDLVYKWEMIIFDEIDVDEISELSDEYYLKVTKMEARLKGSSAVDKLSKLVRDFRSAMPIVQALGNKQLKDYHWDEIKQLLNLDENSFDIQEKQFTLGQLVQLDVGDKQEDIVHIATTAT